MNVPSASQIKSVVFLALGCFAIPTRATSQPEFPSALRFVESKPVTANEVQFVTIAETDWPTGQRIDPVDIQLRITTLSKTDLLFPTFDTFVIKLTTAAGKAIAHRSGRDGTRLTKPLLIPKGASYTLARKAELQWDDKTGEIKLYYWDGTGSVSTLGPLPPGDYKLSFVYSTSPHASNAINKIRDRKEGNAQIWKGDVVTGPVLIKVLGN
jgi:hypothetical protein